MGPDTKIWWGDSLAKSDVFYRHLISHVSLYQLLLLILCMVEEVKKIMQLPALKYLKYMIVIDNLSP